MRLADLDRTWMDQAACRGIADPEAFFPGDGQRGRPNHPAIDTAKAVCHRCPVRERCVDYAIAAGANYGIWGGLTVDQRNRVARKRLEAAS